MLQTLKLNNKKQKKSPFHEEKSLVGLTPGNCQTVLPKERKCLLKTCAKISFILDKLVLQLKSVKTIKVMVILVHWSPL
jgi:hypothetical protein